MPASAAACQARDKGSGTEVWSDSSLPPISTPSHPSTCSLTSWLDYEWPRSAMAAHWAARSLILFCRVPISLHCHRSSHFPFICTFSLHSSTSSPSHFFFSIPTSVSNSCHPPSLNQPLLSFLCLCSLSSSVSFTASGLSLHEAAC